MFGQPSEQCLHWCIPLIWRKFVGELHNQFLEQKHSQTGMAFMCILRVDTDEYAFNSNTYENGQDVGTLSNLTWAVSDEIYEELEHGFGYVALLLENTRNSLEELFDRVFQFFLSFQEVKVELQQFVIVIRILFRRQELVKWLNEIEAFDDPVRCWNFSITALHNLSDDVPTFFNNDMGCLGRRLLF